MLAGGNIIQQRGGRKSLSVGGWASYRARRKRIPVGDGLLGSGASVKEGWNSGAWTAGRAVQYGFFWFPHELVEPGEHLQHGAAQQRHQLARRDIDGNKERKMEGN